MARVMSAQEKAIRQERAVVFDGMQELMTRWDEEGTLDAEEKQDFDRRERDLQRLDKDLARIMKFNELEGAKEDAAETAGMSRDEADSKRKSALERAFSGYLRHGLAGLTNDEKRALTRVTLANGEARDAGALTTDGSGTSGGGFLVPQGFWHNLQVAMKQFGGLLNVANVVETSTGNPMPWPTTDPTSIVGHYVGAQGTQLGFQDYVFGEGMMNAYTITSNVALASLEAMNDSAFDVETFVRERIGESIGRFVAQQLQTGVGNASFPMLGIQTALIAKGIVSGAVGGLYQPAAAQFVNTLAAYSTTPANGQAQLANGLVSFNDIQAMAAKIDPAYRSSGRCTWVCNDHTLWKIRSVTDAFGHPLWQPNLTVGGMDNLYGFPVLIDQNVGEISTTASTATGLMFGDFKTAMVVRQVNNAGVMRLDERYADFLQVGFMGFVRMDARSNDLRAAVLYESPSS